MTAVVIGCAASLILGGLVWLRFHLTRDHRANKKRLAAEAVAQLEAEAAAIERLVQVIETTARRGEWSERRLIWSHLPSSDDTIARIELCNDEWVSSYHYQPYRPDHVILFNSSQVKRIKAALTGERDDMTTHHEIANKILDEISSLDLQAETALMDLQKWTEAS